MTVSVPLVSVLIPLYNHARYITRCLDSVLEDGYTRIEIIIIDDGSKDNSKELAREWFNKQDKNLLERFEIESRPNKGVTRTLNELVCKARGEYITLLASDDYLLKDGISTRLDYLQKNSSKYAVFGDSVVVDDSGIVTHNSGIADLNGGKIECLIDEKLLPIELIYNWCVPGPGFMARRELYDIVGLYDETLTVEDWDMYLRIMARNFLGFTPHQVAAYRYHGDNSILNSRMKMKQLTSIMLTAWKNHRAFHGILRFGLLYKCFKLRQEIAEVQEQTVKAYFHRKICRLLYRLSIHRYHKIIKHISS
ncbi:MAG: glycosyltransferase [Desulfuromonadaceae bacterium]|nr:glycosyltransferase [Desulfuromonadaceae bacterium]MDD2854295.1 glycosyltransferase [Desulfuromonadaceae bacterium]